MKIHGRDWRWWLIRNSHLCLFCYIEKGAQWTDRNEVAHLGKQALDIRGHNRGQYTAGYWTTLYHVWLRHIKEYHPELLTKEVE